MKRRVFERVIEDADLPSSCPLPCGRRRALRQVLIRGDNVVMVWEGRREYKTSALPGVHI